MLTEWNIYCNSVNVDTSRKIKYVPNKEILSFKSSWLPAVHIKFPFSP